MIAEIFETMCQYPAVSSMRLRHAHEKEVDLCPLISPTESPSAAPDWTVDILDSVS